jgi:RNA polymerase sigma-70 factor (ECF subfamily)
METETTTDQELLERIQDKDAGAFAVFYRRHYAFIARRIKSLMADEDMANDFIQEFWIRLWEKPTMLKTNDKGYVFNFLYSFLYTFVLLIHRLYNKHASQLVSLEDLNMLPEDQQYTHVLEDVEANELIGFIDSIVDGLPEPQHSIYELYQQNHSLAYIAKNVLLSEGSVRNYLTKTFKIMRDGIGKQYKKQVPAV